MSAKISSSRHTTGAPQSGLYTVLCVLVTSTTLSVLSQLILDMRAIDPSTQSLAWVKYVVAFINSTVQSWMAGGTVVSKKAKRTMLKIGVIDSVAYGLACYGFSCGGVAWQSTVFSACSPTCSAVLTRFWLRKHVPSRKSRAVAIVVFGLLVSAAPKLLGSAGGSNRILLGIACAFGAALLYSLIGVMYEGLGSDRPPHSEAVRRISMVGITSVSLYQLCYTIPSWNNLVMAPLQHSEIPVWQAIGSHVLFGVIFWIHMQCQSRTLQQHGGLGMSMANACKGPIMVVIGSIFMCSPTRTHSCISVMSALGSIIIASGVFQWATAGSAPSAAKVQNEKKTE